MHLEVGCARAPAPSFPDQQSFTANGEGPAASQEGAQRQAGDTVSLTDTRSSFPPLSDAGGGKGDVPMRENPQVFPPRQRYLSRNKVNTGRTRGQTRQTQPPSTQTRDGASRKVVVVITKLRNVGKTVRKEAAGLGVTFKIAPEIEHENQWGAYDEFGLAVESTSYPGKSDYDPWSPVGMHIGHIESTPQKMAALEDSNYAEYWIWVAKSELKGHVTYGTFSEGNTPQ